MERKYSISEIDRMRNAIKKEIGYPPMTFNCEIGFGGRSKLSPGSRAAFDSFNHEVEDRLRTYLLAGVDPQEFALNTEPTSEAATE